MPSPLADEGWPDYMAGPHSWADGMRCIACGSEEVTPDRVTTDGHDSYPRATRTELGRGVRHRTSRYLNNRLEQDHRGIKGRY